MKGMFNLAGLILVVCVVAFMARKQLNLTNKLPAVEGSTVSTSGGNLTEQTQQLHQQLQQQVNTADQKLRAELDKN